MKKFGKIMVAVLALACLVGACFAFTACNKDGKEIVKVINYKLSDENYAFCVQKGDKEMLNAINGFMEEIKADGTFNAILDKYFAGGTPTAVTSAPEGTENALIVATNAAFEPFEYIEGNNYYGIDMEIAKLFADSLNKPLVILNLDFEAVVTTVQNGAADIGMAGLTVTPGRQEQVDFAEPYYEASQVLIVKADDTTFDACENAADVEAILKSFGKDVTIGYQNGTTGGSYVQGSEDFGFDGLNVEGKGYKAASLAVQDMINGNINYVIVDQAPALKIVEGINAVA